jgi:hypothetical protein
VFAEKADIKSSARRALQTSASSNSLSYNAKLALRGGYGEYFAVNYFVLMLVNGIAWLLTLVFRLVRLYWLTELR